MGAALICEEVPNGNGGASSSLSSKLRPTELPALPLREPPDAPDGRLIDCSR